MTLRCEDVRELLPERAEDMPRQAGEVDEHLQGCAACSAELATYRALMDSLAAFAEIEEEPSEDFLEETLRAIRIAAWRRRLPSGIDLRDGAGRVVAFARERRSLALASLGGLAVGVTAIGLVWWRAAHRAMDAPGVPA